jgi:hypothetical protein
MGLETQLWIRIRCRISPSAQLHVNLYTSVPAPPESLVLDTPSTSLISERDVPTNPLFLPFLILEVESICYIPNLHCSSLLLPALFLDLLDGDPKFEMLVVLVLLIAPCTREVLTMYYVV